MPIYIELADGIEPQIRRGVLRAGERLPLYASRVRYEEAQVRTAWRRVRESAAVPVAQACTTAGCCRSPARTVARRRGLPPGNAELRRCIARRYLEIGAEVDVADIVITNGASEGLMLCLMRRPNRVTLSPLNRPPTTTCAPCRALAEGDAMLFNPALLHAAGDDRSRGIQRMANLLQVSSGFGRAMESVDRDRMLRACIRACRRWAATACRSRRPGAGAGRQRRGRRVPDQPRS